MRPRRWTRFADGGVGGAEVSEWKRGEYDGRDGEMGLRWRINVTNGKIMSR